MEQYNGEKYKGEWKNDYRYGKGLFRIFILGTLYHKDDTSELSEWKDGPKEKKCNLLNLAVASGHKERYKGEMKDRKRDGKGIFCCIIGEYKFANGSYYIGMWKNDKRNGIGKINNNYRKMYLRRWQLL